MNTFKLLATQESKQENCDIFAGKFIRSGYIVTIEVVELERSGMLYIENLYEGVVKPGQVISFFVAAKSAAQAVYATHLHYVNASVKVVERWEACTKYRYEYDAAFDNEADAVEAALFSDWVILRDTWYELEIQEIILNLTQHPATTEQVADGVIEPSNKRAVQSALTFDEIPNANEIKARAEFLAGIAKEAKVKKALIGGAPFFMSALERALIEAGITPVYAFSVRDSIEEPDGKGGVKKTNVFKHVGFVEV
jgi:hypothetical protein